MKKCLLVILSVVLIFASFPLTAFAAVKAPAAPKVTAVSTNKTVTLCWKKVSGANGYEIYSYANKKYKMLAAVNKVKYTVKKLSPAKSYIYAVRAYKKNGKKKKYSKYSKLVKIGTVPSVPTGTKVEAKSFTTITVGFNKSKGATSYTVKVSTDNSFKKNVKTVTSKTNSVKVKGLTDNTNYYYCVCANFVYNKVTYSSAFSNKALAKTNTIPENTRTNVTLSKTYQTVDGFGTSAAWNFQKIGSRSSADKIIKYLYDSKTGIGLNIYRYNVGTNSRYDSNIGDYWRRTDGFITGVDFDNSKITYDFTRDAEAQNCLKLAKKYAGDNLRVTLFHNSPPIELTKNGKAFCDDNGESDADKMETNLDPANYALYSKFCIDIADYFVKCGYRVTDVSPMNEPIYSWVGSNQEGCHYTPSQVAELLSVMSKFAERKSYKISMFEAGAAESEVENGAEPINITYLKTIMNNKNNASYFNSVSVHSYWSDKNRKAEFKKFIDSKYKGMSIACTEYCQMTNDGSTGVYDISSPLADTDPERNGLGIKYGIEMARTIYEDLTVMNATEWNWWLGVSNGYYPDGLVYIDHTDSDDSIVKTSKRLWCLGNFSRFINEGANRVEVQSVNDKILVCGFKNPDGSLVLVYINLNKKAYKTNICVDGYSKYKAYVTSDTMNLNLNSSGEFEKGLSVSIPAESVVSVIVTK